MTLHNIAIYQAGHIQGQTICASQGFRGVRNVVHPLLCQRRRLRDDSFEILVQHLSNKV